MLEMYFKTSTWSAFGNTKIISYNNFMLEAEKIKSNWETYRDLVNQYFPTRKDQLNEMYDAFEERMVMMPASSMAHFHNAFAGGYVDHVLRVIACAEKLYESWSEMGADMSGYTIEELRFAAMHHDLGKVGFPGEGNEVYQIETSDWHVKLSWTEYQAIKIHDGMYDDANKPYFVARSAQAKLKTNLPIVLHHADHLAAQIEFERWRNKDRNTPKPIVEKSKVTKSNGLKNLAENNPDVEKTLTDIFSAFNQD